MDADAEALGSIDGQGAVATVLGLTNKLHLLSFSQVLWELFALHQILGSILDILLRTVHAKVQLLSFFLYQNGMFPQIRW